MASSTVLVVRDGPDTGALEVFMLERHLDSAYIGGALVFPGGKVDARDRVLPFDRWTGIDLPATAARFDVDAADALGLFVSAVRESFEEANVLLAVRDGQPVTAAQLASPTFADARRRLNDRAEHWDWTGWLADEELVLDLGRLALWSWWVTPEGVARRFDTRFFLALSDGDAGAAHDEVEATASRWTTPAAALAASHAGEAMIVFPTRKNLEALAAYPSAEAAWQAAKDGEVDTRRTQPILVFDDVGTMVGVRHPFTGGVEPF